ncbi:MAG: SCP-like extracellular [Ruminococcus sp.]|nr:SCP-like extracellular [Ruminococcus sp.]
MAEEIVILVNEARAENGLNPVYMVPVLNEAGLVRAMETAGYFSHKRPDNSSFATVFDEYQISYKAAAENIAAGSSTAEETFNQWKNSPNHWKTILNESYTHMGVGVYYDPDSDYWWYWEQLFIASDEVFEGQTLPERYKVVPAGFGDIDGDGVITSLDYTLLLKLIQKKVVLNDLQIESADCMRDGAVTIADAIVLKKYLLHFYDDLPRYP